MSALDRVMERVRPRGHFAGRAPAAPAPGLPPRSDSLGHSQLRERRNRLAEELAELQWDLGGLAYEMAIRDHFRLDVIVRAAARVQEVDAELGEVERLLSRGRRRRGHVLELWGASLARGRLLLAVRRGADGGSPARRAPERRVGQLARALFVCLHNAGRSQMAAALFARAGRGRHEADSAGTQPAQRVHPEVVEVMAELGFDLAGVPPRRLGPAQAGRADVVVTMGCGDACPVLPGKRYLDWELTDPRGRPLDEVRAIRDDIARRVDELARQLDAEAAAGVR